jgi:hypothetical protein
MKRRERVGGGGGRCVRGKSLRGRGRERKEKETLDEIEKERKIAREASFESFKIFAQGRGGREIQRERVLVFLSYENQWKKYVFGYIGLKPIFPPFPTFHLFGI